MSHRPLTFPLRCSRTRSAVLAERSRRRLPPQRRQTTMSPSTIPPRGRTIRRARCADTHDHRLSEPSARTPWPLGLRPQRVAEHLLLGLLWVSAVSAASPPAGALFRQALEEGAFRSLICPPASPILLFEASATAGEFSAAIARISSALKPFSALVFSGWQEPACSGQRRRSGRSASPRTCRGAPVQPARDSSTFSCRSIFPLPPPAHVQPAVSAQLRRWRSSSSCRRTAFILSSRTMPSRVQAICSRSRFVTSAAVLARSRGSGCASAHPGCRSRCAISPPAARPVRIRLLLAHAQA